MDYLAKTLNISHLFVSSSQPSPSSSRSSVPGEGSSHQSTTTTTTAFAVDEMDSGKETTTQFGSALETMDRFLENDSNLLVQSLVSLEAKTNISRRYLARGVLFLLAGYFLFSNSVLDLVTHLLMYLYPSYRSYLLLKNPQLSREDLTDILKYWIFIGLFSTFDFTLGVFIPFASVFKLIFIIQCSLPRRSPVVDLAIKHAVTPLYRYLEQNEKIQQVNTYLSSLSSNLASGEQRFDVPHQD